MVTSAAFADINQDGWMDLVVTGEWMGIKIFLNEKGVFRSGEIAHSTGLWQTVHIADLNGDGLPDILAGNWGHNSKLFAGKDGPLKMYVKDFDFNGTTEQVMTYSIKGQEYPFLGKDQLELALPVLKRAHIKYDEVAGKSVQFLFGDLLTNSSEWQAETLGSAAFINDGKGNFSRKDLPEELQLAPVFAFSSFPGKGGKTAWLAAGNFYGVLPYEGRYDALNPTLFDYDSVAARFNYLSDLPATGGECRDAKWINYAGSGKILVLAYNNGQLVFLKPG